MEEGRGTFLGIVGEGRVLRGRCRGLQRVPSQSRDSMRRWKRKGRSPFFNVNSRGRVGGWHVDG